MYRANWYANEIQSKISIQALPTLSRNLFVFFYEKRNKNEFLFYQLNKEYDIYFINSKKNN